MALALLAGVAACSKGGDPTPQRGAPPLPSAPAAPPASAAGTVTISIVYGSEKKSWIEEQISAFNASGAKLPSGERVAVVGKAMGSGEAVDDILAGRLRPAVFSPASAVYTALLNDHWLAQPGHTSPIAVGGDSVVVSPVVIAMWKPMAEALGWPKQSLGWSDIIKMGRGSAGWAGKGRPEWGRFKLGHTHPEYSSSGLLAVLAEAYAGAGKKRALSAADVRSKKTRAFVEAVEREIVHYGKSTGFFADKMVQRGPSYLSAAVLYENLIVEAASPAPGRRAPDLPLVAIYPREGTFWADHPYCPLATASPNERKGADLFLARLKGRPAQERALELGFRPADPAVAIGSPIDAAHGVDPKQPQTLLEVPPVPTLQALLETWREVKKPSDVTLVFDKSGSMQGEPLQQAKAGARAFLENLGARDDASLVFFDNQIYPAVGPRRMATGRAELESRVDGVIASGGTALYDAVAGSFEAARARAASEPNRIHALVVMTDGKDEGSQLVLDALKQRLPRGEEGAPVKIFTIGYGAAAQAGPLEAIAEAGDGSHAKGTVANIVQVYREVASFF